MQISRELFPAENEIGPRLTKLLGYLGYADDPAFIDPSSPSVPHEVEHAMKVGVSGAYCLRTALAGGGSRQLPVVYVAVANDEAHADEIHRDVWTQNVAPLLVIARRDGIQIRNGFDIRRGGRLIPWEVVEQRKSNQQLAAISAASLVTSVGWRDFALRPGRRVDEHLLSAVAGLSGAVRARFSEMATRRRLVNALIGRMLYLFVLIDRKVVTQDWVDGLVEGTVPLCPDIRIDADPLLERSWPATQTWALFDAVDQALNGSIFPIPSADRLLIAAEAIDLVRRVLRHDDIVGGHLQLGFDSVRYRSIRTETISAIYELFLTLDDPQLKVRHGAFYTPPYLADYLLDELEGVSPLSDKSVVCDPACGSGIFLVGAFRRIVERSGVKADAAALQSILTGCIYGVEQHPQAADVARFSLYLTMLDYLPDFTLTGRGRHCAPLFPPLGANVLEQDFFGADLPTTLASKATHVVANPPWTRIEAGSAAERFASVASGAVSDRRLSELFVWGIRDKLLGEGGAMALLLSTKSFIAPVATRIEEKGFPYEVASRLRLRGLVNLSHFRYKLFRGARNPALAMIAINDRPDEQAVWVAAPLLSSQPAGDNGPWAIAIDRGDVIHVPAAEFTENARTWFWSLMLQPMDRRYARRLGERARTGSCKGTTLGEFLRDAGMVMRNGDSPARTGVPPHLLLGTDPKEANHFVRRLGLSGLGQKDYSLPSAVTKGLRPVYRTIFGGEALLITRNLNRFDVVAEPVAFNSSLNAIAFGPDSKVRPEQRLSVLHAISRFLGSQLASYLYALVGRLWILDRRRFESPDLAELPFPFRTVAELLEAVPASLTGEDLVDSFVAAFELDALFNAAVREYAGFRRGYEDGQLPLGGADVPGEQQKKMYQEQLTATLGHELGRQSLPSLHRHADGAKASLVIDVGRCDHEEADPATPAPRPEYAWATSVDFQPARGVVTLMKPLTRAAWTLERAYADAQRVADAIRSA